MFSKADSGEAAMAIRFEPIKEFIGSRVVA